MKKTFLIISILFCFGTMNSQNNVTKVPQKFDLLSVSPFDVFGQHFRVNYEHLVNNKGFFISGGLTFGKASEKSQIGFKGEFQYRYYPFTFDNNSKATKNLNGGFYVAPYVFYRYLEVTNKDYNRGYYNSYGNYVSYAIDSKDFITTGSLGVVAGFNLICYKKVNVDFFFGGGIKMSEGNISGYSPSIITADYNGVVPKVGFEIGIAL